MDQYGLSAYHSERLVLDCAVSDFFGCAAELTRYPKMLASLMLSEVLRLMNDGESQEIALQPKQAAAVADMLGETRINGGGAKKIIGALWGTRDEPEAVLAALDLEQISDDAILRETARRVISENAGMANDLRAGKQVAMKALMGRAMAELKGKANPERMQEHLLDALAE